MKRHIHRLEGLVLALAVAALCVVRPASGGDEHFYLARQTPASASTYTPTAGTRYVLLKGCGAGGGGGGGKGGTSLVGFGGGGASGAYMEKFIDCGGLCTGSTITLGTAGAAGAATPTTGTAGGDTTAIVNGVTYTFKGGAGGLNQSGVSSGTVLGGGFTTGTTAGDVVTHQMPGGNGFALSTALGISGDGGGGAGAIGGAGGKGVNTAAAGGAGQGNCSGGGGGGSVSTTGQAGGAGTAGLVVIDEFH